MTRLFIENIEIELNEETRFAITKQFEELSNPTIICNDWSKTVSIPFTQKNNETFNYIYNVDRIITEPVLNNLLPSEPSEMKQWAGSSYQDTTLQEGQIVTTTMADYVRICFLNGNIEHTFSKNYRFNNETHETAFTYNPVDDVYLEFSFIDSDSTAPDKELLYCRFDLSDSGLVNGKEYVVKFSHKIEDGKCIVYDFSVKEKVVPIGIQFNPLTKLTFRLEWDNDVIMIGYAKTNEIKQVDGKGTYEITLFGQLGKVFQQMKNITFDRTTEDTEYLIDGSQYVEEYINKDLVYQSWTSFGQDTSVLKKKTDAGYHVTDIIGFAPNNSFSSDFDYKTFQTGYVGKSFTDVLGSGFTTDTGVEPDTAIPNGLLPREIGEYRSYQQLPFIYWNKLFNIFREKTEEITGYKVELDDTWFNESNPYWYNLVYMLKPFNDKNNSTFNNKYRQSLANNIDWTTQYSGSTSYIVYNVRKNSNLNYIKGYSNEQLAIYDFDNQRYNIAPNQNGTICINMGSLNFTMAFSDGGWNNYLHFGKKNALILSLRVTGANGNVEDYKILIANADTDLTDTSYFPNFNESDYLQIIRLNDEPDRHTGDRVYWSFSVGLNSAIDYYTFGKFAKLSFSGIWYNNEAVMKHIETDFRSGVVSVSLANGGNSDVQYNTYTFRSNSYFTLNDLWDNERNPLTEILNYCRIFRIIPWVDYYNKVLHFEAANNYFKRSREKDWTIKLDKSKDYIIKPVTFENKYILFNYADNDTKLGKEYKEKYGVNYCDYRLITDYQFNTDTQNLFKDKITPSIVNTDNVLSWTNLYDNHRIIYSFPAETYVYCRDKDNKTVDVFGSFFFHNGLADFSTEPELYMRSVKLSDDTSYQKSINTYFYTQNAGESQPVTTYPMLNIVRGDNMCVFNTPKENYTYNNNYENKETVYGNFWERYLNERYNPQNKLVTCYVKLSPMDFRDFQFYDLIKIGNQRYLVNKIYDYDMTSNGLTKVDLITVQDFNNYTLADFPTDYIRTTPSTLTIPYDYYKMITVSSSGDWEVHADDHSDYLVVIPDEGHSGDTEVIIGSINEEGGYTLRFDLLDDESVIATTSLPCSVGGTSTLTVSQWYNNITVGGNTTVTITSDSEWHVLDDWSGGSADVTITPTHGSAGETIVLISSNSGTGVNDYYMENESGDIASFRIHVTE